MPDYSDVEESPRGSGGGTRRFSGMGPEPPSPISLMPARFEPPSPISLRPRTSPPSPLLELRPRTGPPSPLLDLRLRPAEPSSPMIDLRPRFEPPSPGGLSLRPRYEPPSPVAGAGPSDGGQTTSPPGYLPYSAYTAGGGSPMISLVPRGPASPIAGGGLDAPGTLGTAFEGSASSGIMSPTARGAGGGTGGLTLQQILQQYSSRWVGG